LADESLKNVGSIDDWDSLPLNDEADDWDLVSSAAPSSTPAPNVPPSPKASPDLQIEPKLEPKELEFDRPLDQSRPSKLGASSAKLGDSSLKEASDWDSAEDDFDSPPASSAQEDDFDSPPASSMEEDDFDTPPASSSEVDDFDSPQASSSEVGDFDAHLKISEANGSIVSDWDEESPSPPKGSQSSLGEIEIDDNDIVIEPQESQESGLKVSSETVGSSSEDDEAKATKATDSKLEATPTERLPTDSSSEAGASPAEGDAERAQFLKSLMDGSDEAVPQKVELDLDGIFDNAKMEAEKLSPDATHPPVEAPMPDPVPANEMPDIEPISQSGVKKVNRIKLFILFGLLSLFAIGLLFAVYRIFFSHVEVPVAPVIETEPVETIKAPIPGELVLDRFFITCGEDNNNAVVIEMEIILHYRDESDVFTINSNMTFVRDLIYRLTKAVGTDLLVDVQKRHKLQADLLSTLNNLDSFKSISGEPTLTYVQISILKRR
jgi:flagellar basal body-associated protein FliL